MRLCAVIEERRAHLMCETQALRLYSPTVAVPLLPPTQNLAHPGRLVWGGGDQLGRDGHSTATRPQPGAAPNPKILNGMLSSGWKPLQSFLPFSFGPGFYRGGGVGGDR